MQYKRGEWHDAARVLAQANPDMSYSEIGRLLGVTQSAVWKLFHPERAREWGRQDNANPERQVRKRAWDRINYERVKKDRCVCGMAKMKDAERCEECQRATTDVRRTLAEGMWADGWLLREIDDVLGWTTRNVIAMRERGWDLPHRYKMRNGRRVAA